MLVWLHPPSFVFLDPSLYPTYPIRIKGFDYLIFRNYIGYVLGNVYPVPEQLVPSTYTPYFVGNQFPIVVQPMTSRYWQLTQQLVTTLVPTIVHVTVSLSIYVHRGFIH